jgi:hypothetical protein
MGQNTGESHYGFSGCRASFGLFPAMAFRLVFRAKHKAVPLGYVGIAAHTNQR